jgi:hypothetical protein
MRYSAAARSSRKTVLAGFIVSLFAVLSFVPSAAAQTGVHATICVPSSSITITQPINDSTVTTTELVVSGTVDQANQIEVYVDDEFDNTIPLTIGQTQYSSTIQLPVGTHTLRVEAINSCGGQNGQATSVVTYAAPPTQASVGSETPTGVNPAQDSTITIGTPGAQTGTLEGSRPYLGLPPLIGKPLEEGLRWLDITPFDSMSDKGGLSLTRAAIITVSMYFLLFGLISKAVHILAGSAAFVAATPHRTMLSRRHMIAWGVRGLALLVLLLALFL